MGLHMSHHTGAQSIALECQIIELIPKLIQAMAVQIMKRHVPAFRDWRCHGSGMRTSTAAKKVRIGKAGYVGSDILGATGRSNAEEACLPCFFIDRTDAWNNGG